MFAIFVIATKPFILIIKTVEMLTYLTDAYVTFWNTETCVFVRGRIVPSDPEVLTVVTSACWPVHTWHSGQPGLAGHTAASAMD